MGEEKGNISSTFGKYRDESIGQVKNVSSADWVPISTGKSSGIPGHNPAKPQQKPQKKASAKKKGASSAKKGNGQKSASGLDGIDLISGGNPHESRASKPKSSQKNTSSKGTSASGKAKQNKPASSKNSQQKKSSATRNSDPRTPIQRDDRRKQQKHNAGIEKTRRDYRESAKDGVNHDEFCKQKNETKRKKNTLNRLLTVGGVLLLAVFIIGVIFYSKGAPIETIIIEGKTVYTDEEICQAAGVVKGRNLYVFSQKKVKHDITTKLPYIKDVILEKNYPDTILLRVIPTQDKYVITSTSGWITLDKDGKVVSVSRDKVEPGMYQIEGFDYQKVREGEIYVPEDSNVERYRIMRQMVELFDKADVIDTAVIKLHNVDDVVVEYGGKIAVYFGNCDDLETKVPGASGILDIAIAKKANGYIDMRYKDHGTFTPGGMTIQ